MMLAVENLADHSLFETGWVALRLFLWPMQYSDIEIAADSHRTQIVILADPLSDLPANIDATGQIGRW